MKVKIEICKRIYYSGIIDISEERYRLLKENGVSSYEMSLFIGNHSNLALGSEVEWELIKFEGLKNEG